jgi:hypothetical protein
MAFVCEKSLKRTYAEKIGEFLGITGENDIQRSSRAQFYKRKDRDKMRKQSDAYQNRCKIRKIVTATRVAKESAKDTSYKPGKVPLASIGRRTSSAKKDSDKSAKPRKCGICGVYGHIRTACVQPGSGRHKETSSTSAPKRTSNGDASAPTWFDLMH